MISMQVEKRERKRKGDPGGYVETYSHDVRECFRAEGRSALADGKLTGNVYTTKKRLN